MRPFSALPSPSGSLPSRRRSGFPGRCSLFGCSQHPAHAQPGADTDQPALQPDRDPGSAGSLSAARPVGRPPAAPAPFRDSARSGRRSGDSGRSAARARGVLRRRCPRLDSIGRLAAAGRPAPNQPEQGDHRRLILGLALAVGTIGGIYGIGGGSILGPILVGLGFTVSEVAPAALTATFLTSLAGVAAFAALSINGGGDIAPDLGGGDRPGSWRPRGQLPRGVLPGARLRGRSAACPRASRPRPWSAVRSARADLAAAPGASLERDLQRVLGPDQGRPWR